MYKYLILGVTFLVLGGAGYYFNSSGGSDLLVRAIAQTDGQDYGVSGIEVFSGRYECINTEGCTVATYFMLNNDTTLEITQYNEEAGNEVTVSTGSWGVGSGGAIVFLVDPVTSGELSPPFSFVAKKISTLKLSGFSGKIKTYRGLNNPTFTRISDTVTTETE